MISRSTEDTSRRPLTMRHLLGQAFIQSAMRVFEATLDVGELA